MIRVALIDDHPATLLGLRRLIEAEPDLQLLAAAPSAAELAGRLDTRPDVLVIDNDAARGDGLRQCRRSKNRRSAPGVVIYTAHTSPALALAARVAHADALVDKSAPVGELLEAIRAAAAREVALPEVPQDVYRAAVSRIDDEDLPVLAMLLDREPLPAIAKALRCDVGEVAWRSQRILGRLAPGARRQRAEAVSSARP